VFSFRDFCFDDDGHPIHKFKIKQPQPDGVVDEKTQIGKVISREPQAQAPRRKVSSTTERPLSLVPPAAQEEERQT
jgi:hypothetical protein